MLYAWILVESLTKFDVSVSITKTDTFYTSFHVQKPPSIYDSLILSSLFNLTFIIVGFLHLLKVTVSTYKAIYLLFICVCVGYLPQSRFWKKDLWKILLHYLYDMYVDMLLHGCFGPTQWTMPPLNNTVTLHHQLCYHEFRCVH